MGRALIIVDVQNDFCEGGSLAVAGGAAVAAAINRHLAGTSYDEVVATADFHIDPGDHFAAEPDFATTWPVHCKAGTGGANLHPDLDPRPIRAVFRKGAYTAAYSGFEGTTDGVPAGVAVEDLATIPGPDAGAEADSASDRAVSRPEPVSLADWLSARGIESVDVCGIATDYCVRATALDAARLGLSTRVLLDLTAGVAAATTRSTAAELRAAGVELVGAPWVGAGPLEV